MKKEMRSPWNFDAPEYDRRSSCFVNAGTHHGSGKPQPIGSMKHDHAHVIPQKAYEKSLKED